MSRSGEASAEAKTTWDALFLIHGVGNPEPGDVRRDFLEAGHQIEIHPDQVYDLNWNGSVEGPASEGTVDSHSMLRLSRSIQRASLIGFDLTEGGFRGAVGVVHDRLATALRIVAGLAPILLVWFGLSLLWRGLHVEVGTPWVRPEVELFSYRAWWNGTLFLFYPLQFGKWYAGLRPVFEVWLQILGALSGAVFVTAVLRKGVRGIWPALRLVVLSLLAPIIYILGMPWFVPSVVVFGLGAYLVMTTLLGIPSYSTVPLDAVSVRLDASVSFREYADWGGAGRTLLIAFASFIVAGLLYQVVSPVLKVVADIFRYLGSAEYRSRVRRVIREEISTVLEARPGANVILAGHSLGSVIALDLLREADGPLRRAGTVRLLTGGSPLRRIFHRFFPSWYAHPRVYANQLRSVYGDFFWINVFRPLDYIGGCLGRARDAPLRNRIVWKLHRLHVGYWKDKKVVRSVQCCLADSDGWEPRSQEPRESMKTPVPPPDRDPSLPGRSFIYVTPVLLGLLSAISFTALETRRARNLFEGQLDALAVGGNTIDGTLIRVQREVWEDVGEYGGGGLVEVPEYWVRFTPPGDSEVHEATLAERFHDVKGIDTYLEDFRDENPGAAAGGGAPAKVHFLLEDPTKAHAPAFRSAPVVSVARAIGGLVQFLISAMLASFLLVVLTNAESEEGDSEAASSASE